MGRGNECFNYKSPTIAKGGAARPKYAVSDACQASLSLGLALMVAQMVNQSDNKKREFADL